MANCISDMYVIFGKMKFRISRRIEKEISCTYYFTKKNNPTKRWDI